MKDNETVKGNVSAQRAGNKEITPPNIRQNDAHCGHVEEYSDDRPTTPTAGHHDASQSNAQNYLRRKFGNFSVQWLPLGEVCEIFIGGEPPKDTIKGDSKDEKHPYPVWANGKDIYGYSSTYRIDKDATVISSIGSVGYVYFRKAYFTPIIRLKVLVPKKDNLMPKYLYYYLSTISFASTSKTGVVASINKNDVKKVVIPIPPLEVQAEVVRILDKFSRLTSELQKELDAELKARKLQYEYYRDQLLSFGTDDPKVQWLPLGEVCETISTNKKILSKQYQETGITPIIDQGVEFIAGYTDELPTIPIDKYVIFGDHSEHIKYVDFPFIQGADGLKILKVFKGLLPKYLYYAFINFYKKENNYKRHWSRARDTVIPIPPIAEQERIVGILDKFDKLTNSLTEGIPKEIEMRQLQYEYYRDALLSF